MDEEFDLWNEKKKEINKRLLSSSFVVYERQIWWGSLGKNIGSEQNGKNLEFERPLLVFRVFSKDTLWVIPLTTRKIFNSGQKEYELVVNNIKQIADISQLRFISVKRLSRFIDNISYEDVQKIRESFKNLN